MMYRTNEENNNIVAVNHKGIGAVAADIASFIIIRYAFGLLLMTMAILYVFFGVKIDDQFFPLVLLGRLYRRFVATDKRTEVELTYRPTKSASVVYGKTCNKDDSDIDKNNTEHAARSYLSVCNP